METCHENHSTRDSTFLKLVSVKGTWNCFSFKPHFALWKTDLFFFLHRKRRLLTVRQLSIFLLKFFVLVRRAVLGDAQMPENPTPLLSLQMRFWCWKIKGNNKVRPGRTTENFTQEHFTDPEFLKLLHTQFYWLPCKHNPDQVREKCKQKLCI